MAYPLPLQAARVIANNDHPYLNALMRSLQPVECPGLGTHAVDQYLRLYYDPVVATKWSPQELANVLYHETWHVINNHAARAEALGIASHGRYTDLALAEIWRIAVEPPANEPLRQENLMLPGRPIFWQDIKGQPASRLFGATEYIDSLPANERFRAAGSNILPLIPCQLLG